MSKFLEELSYHFVSQYFIVNNPHLLSPNFGPVYLYQRKYPVFWSQIYQINSLSAVGVS